MSGDGILHEVINAIFHRREEDLSFDIPVGTIPAGIHFYLLQSIILKFRLWKWNGSRNSN